MNRKAHASPHHAASVRHRSIGSWLLILALVLSVGACVESEEKAVKRVKKSTVRVVILAGDEIMGHGSGFVISDKGHIATNRHVIETAEQAIVVYAEGDRVFLRTAELVAVSETADLAILKIDPIRATVVAELAVGVLEAGQSIMTVGFPGALDIGTWATLEGVEMHGTSGEGRITKEEAKGDFDPAVFSGAVAKNITEHGTRLCLHSAKISGGNSGGPLVDSEGRVCGINTAILPASLVGVDYPISIHASELVALARAHSIPFDVTSSKASSAGSLSGIHLLLYFVLAVFAVVMFLMVLRKPRMVMVDAMSRVIRSHKHDRPAYTPRQAHLPVGPQSGHSRPSMPAGVQGSMRLRGRDLQGLSFDVAFSGTDFRRHGNRLVIGRNNDLSQLVIPHDSVSRQHSTLSVNGSSIEVEDRNSGNGTKVNGREISVGAPPVPLNPGDKLTLGEVDLIFEVFH